MKYYLMTKLKLLGLYTLQVILFCLPLAVLMIIYKDTFFTKSTAVGISGLGLLGVIIYILSVKQIIGKLPKILYFVFLFVLFVAMDSLSSFLKEIGAAMLIGAVISLPLNNIIHVYKVDGETDLIENSKLRFKERKKKEKSKDYVEVEVE